MDVESLKKSIDEYKQQLKQIDLALSSSNEEDKNDLISLKTDILQLIELTEENLKHLTSKNQPSASTSQTNQSVDDEYLLFMQEMAKEGVESNVKKKLEEEQRKDLEEDLKSLEGMKCQAPHKHSWGGVTYHNALVCGAISNQDQNFNDIQVRIFFTNPTHQEMLPCPYFLEDSNCKFSDEKCKFSHGEIVSFSSLKEYIEPNFEKLKINSRVLVKNNSDNLWHRAVILKIGINNCSIRYESSKKEETMNLKDILPLEDSEENEEDSTSSDSDSNSEENGQYDWAVQKSLLSLTPSQVLGDWEKHTKGIGSRLMQKMGYIIGTGLGKNAEGRIEPVQAVILPSGKSLDHCMNLRELANGDEDLFSAERKFKKKQRQQQALSKKNYEKLQEKNKKNVFEFLNDTLTLKKDVGTTQTQLNQDLDKEKIKSGTNRDLNVASLKLEGNIKKIENDIYKLKDNLKRQKANTVMHKNLLRQLSQKEMELNDLKNTEKNVKKEQNLRKNEKKLTIF